MTARHPTPREPRSSSWDLNATPGELRKGLADLATRENVAALLELPYWQLDYYVRRSAAVNRYRKFRIPKRRGGFREISAPTVGLKILQRKLARVFAAAYRRPNCVYGFATGRSIVGNAKAHVKQTWVLNVDLKDFFPSITFPRVLGMLRSKPYSLPPTVATLLAQICCTPPLAGVPSALPQGAPTSPVLSNMLCSRLDGQLMALARTHRLTYTRYADDLTFSATRPFPKAIAVRDGGLTTLGEELTRVLTSNGFQPNPSKVRLQHRGERQEVTGLTVNRFPNVERCFVREIRGMLHAWEKFGEDAAEAVHQTKVGNERAVFRAAVLGKIGYLRMVRGEGNDNVIRLSRRYEILTKGPTLQLSVVQRLKAAVWVVDTGLQTGTGFELAGYGMLTCAHVICDASDRLVAYRGATPSDEKSVKVLYSDENLDLALLSFPNGEGAALTISGPRPIDLEEKVRVAGFPNWEAGENDASIASTHVIGFYDEPTVMERDVVSQRNFQGGGRCRVNGAIFTGMSGGPVVDSQGLVVGVASQGSESMRKRLHDDNKHAFIDLKTLLGFLREAKQRTEG